jgi:hypothetical protein
MMALHIPAKQQAYEAFSAWRRNTKAQRASLVLARPNPTWFHSVF